MAGDIGVGLDDNLLGAGLREAAAPRFAEESWQCADAMRTWADASGKAGLYWGPVLMGRVRIAEMCASASRSASTDVWTE
jgi:hypothetical protein